MFRKAENKLCRINTKLLTMPRQIFIYVEERGRVAERGGIKRCIIKLQLLCFSLLNIEEGRICEAGKR